MDFLVWFYNICGMAMDLWTISSIISYVIIANFCEIILNNEYTVDTSNYSIIERSIYIFLAPLVIWFV